MRNGARARDENHADRPRSRSRKAARRLVEIANSVEVVQALRPEILAREQALEQAKSLARAERDKA